MSSESLLQRDPKFNCWRMEGCICIIMNLPMTKEMLAILNNYDDLQPHEVTLRDQLQQLLTSKYGENIIAEQPVPVPDYGLQSGGRNDPQVSCRRVVGCICLLFNIPAARDFLSVLEEELNFGNLRPYERALLEQLRQFTTPKPRDECLDERRCKTCGRPMFGATYNSQTS